jgi:hypothetical protein
LEIKMKTLIAGLCVISGALIVAAAGCAQSRADGNPKFQIDIQAAAQGGPRFTVMNVSGKTISACVLEISITSDGKGQSRIVWDGALQGERPLEQGASISENLPRVVGAPLADRTEVIAGIWSDGEAFGQSDWVKIILANRAARISSYEQETSFLQRGLDKNWTREQYLEGLSGMPIPGIFSGIRTTLEANQSLNNKPELLQRVIHTVLESLNQKLELIRQAKTPTSATPAP